MKLPLSELKSFDYLVNSCINDCVDCAQIEKLSGYSTSLYPGIIAQLERMTQLLYQYMLETEKCFPLFAGAGSDFMGYMDDLQSTTATIMKHHIPQRYKNSTGANNSCHYLEQYEGRQKLKREIEGVLTEKKILTRMEEFEDYDDEIDKELIDWMNMLSSIFNYLNNKRENPTKEEIHNTFKKRYQKHIETYQEKLDKEARSFLYWSDDNFMLTVDDNIKSIFSYDDPLW